MQIVTIKRTTESDAGTEGILTATGFKCRTLELPWRNNRRQRSCIPSGQYRCHLVDSPRFGLVYLVNGTEPRTGILIHAGNHAGDTERGYKSDVQGCILLGDHIGTLAGQTAILNSRATVRAFIKHMQAAPFLLKVEPSHAL